MSEYFWEDCIKKHLKEQKKRYLIKIGKQLRIYNDTSPEVIMILIEMRRVLKGSIGE